MYNLRNSSKKKKEQNNAVMYAAALQDHFLKKNNYNLLDMKTMVSTKVFPHNGSSKNVPDKLPQIKK